MINGNPAKPVKRAATWRPPAVPQLGLNKLTEDQASLAAEAAEEAVVVLAPATPLSPRERLGHPAAVGRSLKQREEERQKYLATEHKQYLARISPRLSPRPPGTVQLTQDVTAEDEEGDSQPMTAAAQLRLAKQMQKSVNPLRYQKSPF